MTKFSPRRRVGNVGEGIACKFLERRGYLIVERNYLRKWGEIDIVAERGGIVHFVEVKTAQIRVSTDISRERTTQYMPEELVTKAKLRKLARTASLYMEEHRDTREYQIDVVSVIMDPGSRTASCRLYEQALESNL